MNIYCPKQQQIPQATPLWDLLKMTLSPLSATVVFGAGEIEEGELFGKGRSGIVKEQHTGYFSIAVGVIVLAVVWSTGSINCRLAIFHTERHEQRYTPFWEKNAPKGVFCQQYNQSFCLSLRRATVGREGVVARVPVPNQFFAEKTGMVRLVLCPSLPPSLESIVKYKKDPLYFIIFRYI